MLKKTTFFFCLLILGWSACTDEGNSNSQTTTVATPQPELVVPKFEKDSAYQFIEKQVAFGPRVPNSKAHQACKEWLVSKFQSFGGKVIKQDFNVKNYKNETMKATNIIVQYNLDKKKRVLLAAHWDSRFIADYDSDEAKKKQPVPGADDGASGVGVLLEMARVFNNNKIDLGIDIILFDVEDQGESQGKETTWCLGAQYWSRNKHNPGYNAKFGILFDMVGARNARFTKEEVSMRYAPRVMNNIWKIAKEKGYSNYFAPVTSGPLTDDHLFVNQIAKIPMIDIINRPQGSQTGFGHYWHTHKDDMNVIDKRTLRAVGQTVLTALYRESVGKF